MKKPFVWVILAIITLLAIQFVWVALDEPDDEYLLIARPYNLYTGTTEPETTEPETTDSED